MTSPTPVTADDGSRTYRYPPTGEEYWSVTTIIGGTQSKPWLEPWAASLAAEWVVDNIDQLAELGRDDFLKLAKTASKRIREIKADAGSYTHAVVEALILWYAAGDPNADILLPTVPERLEGQMVDELPIEDFAEQCFEGFLNFVEDHDPQFLAAEMQVYNRDLRVAGTLDFVALMRNLKLTSCVDVKTGKHLDGSKEQLPAYRRMTECLMPMGVIQPMPATDCCMVLHLRPEYERGYRLMQITPADDAAGWNRFRRAARLYAEREEVAGKPGPVVYPPLPDGSQPPLLLADLDDEGYGRILRPLTKAGLRTVADVAGRSRADCLQIKGIGLKTIHAVEQLLATHGLAFATPDPERTAA